MAKSYWIGDVLSGSHDGAEVELKGWVHTSRGSNKIRFVVLRDSTGTVQCVIKREEVGDSVFEELAGALIESSVVLRGTVTATDREHGHEVQISTGEVIGPVSPDRPFPITESAMAEADGGETEFLLDNRHLYLRTGRMTTMLKIRSSVFGAVHSSETSTSSSIKRPTSWQGRSRAAVHYSRSLTLEERHTLRNPGNYTLRPPCLL